MSKNKFYYLFPILIIFIVLMIHSLQDPYTVNPSLSLLKPNFHHLFGTDYLGRDLYSRVIFGTLYSIVSAIICLIFVCLISLVLGGLAGLELGFFSKMILIFADILYCLPSILLALVFVGLFSNSIFTVLFSFILSWSGKYIRYIRGLVIDIRRQEYIQLSYQRGCNGIQTLFHHILPNLMVPITSLFITDVGKIVLSISGLSFLGIGVQPPQAELGTILYDAKQYFISDPWLIIPPGVAIILILILTQFLSDKFKSKGGIHYD